jgi:hypothetical protein
MKHVIFIESYQVCLTNHVESRAGEEEKGHLPVSGHLADCPRINLVSFYESDILPVMKDAYSLGLTVGSIGTCRIVRIIYCSYF